MTNDDSALREVDQALAEDRQWAMFRKHGPVYISLGVAIVLAVAGWQIWTTQKGAKARDAALEYATALEALAETPADGRIALEGVSAAAPTGYAHLADLRRAGSIAAADRAGALALYRKIYGDRAAPRRLGELARLRAAALSFEDGREAVLGDLGSLPTEQSMFGYYARELEALAALEAEDYQTAYDMFSRAAFDLEAPEPVRIRAKEFAALAAAGKSGVNISGETRVDDLLEALGEKGVAANGGHDASHDHEGDEATAAEVGGEASGELSGSDLQSGDANGEGE